MNKTSISSILVYVSSIIRAVFSFLTFIYIVHYLSVTDYGAYKLIASIITFATYFTSLGLENTLVRFIPENISKGNYKNVNRILLLSLIARISLIFLFIGILFVFKQSIFSFFNLPDILMVWLPVICLIIFLSRTKSLFGKSLLSSYLELYINEMNVIAVTILRFFFFLLVIFNNWGLVGLIISMLCVEIISFCYFLFFAIKKYRNNNRKTSHIYCKGNNYKRIIRFSLYSFLAVTGGIFKETMIDNFVISYFLGPTHVGLYSFAVALVGITRQFSPMMILRGVFNPLLVKKYYTAKEDKNVLIFFFTFFNKLFYFISIPMFIGLGMLSKEIIIFIFDVKYLSALPVIYILLSSYTIGLLSATFVPIINTIEKNELFFYSIVFSIYNLIMDIILISKFGIIGAAIATGSALFLQYYYYYYFVRKVSKINFVIPYKCVLKVLLNFTPSVIFLLFFKKYIANLGLLIVAIIFSSLIYFIASYYNKLFSGRERQMINNSIGKKIWVF